MTQWDPTTYLQFADERARPFVDLIAQVRAQQPAPYDVTSYLDDLTSVGCSVNARETTDLHLLTGPDAVLRRIFVVAQRTANRT